MAKQHDRTGGGPHQGGAVLQQGAPLDQARAAMILVHGRGATAASILDLTEEFAATGIAYFAPQAAGNTWYPYSFLAPLEANEPGLSSALEVVGDLVARIEAQGLPPEKILLLGFSQGACLALEFAARNAQRYGGVIGLSGGLIGPEGTPRDYTGSLEGVPVFLGCGDRDPHIPIPRVHESAEVLRRLQGNVTERIYPGMGHTVHEDELNYIRQLLASLA